LATTILLGHFKLSDIDPQTKKINLNKNTPEPLNWSAAAAKASNLQFSELPENRK